jgi:diacylglycerol kinase (ATP)
MAAANLIVVIHPSATRFTAQEIRSAIEAAAHERGLSLQSFELPADRAGRTALSRTIRDAIRSGSKRVIAAGGDGTIGFVAGALAASKDGGELGLLPAGTANVLARELGLTGSLSELAAIAVGSEDCVAIDGIRIGERTVLTQVGIGPDALMIRDTSRELQARVGRLAYIVSFFRGAFRHRSHRFSIEVDGRPIRARAWQVVIANAGSFGTPPFTWGPGIDPTDGALDLCIYDVRRLRDYFVLAWRVFAGRHQRDLSTRFFPVRERAVIGSERPIPVQGDGEILGRTPVTVQVVPAAVKVVVKRAVEGAGITASLPRGAGSAVGHDRAREEVPAGTVGRDVEEMLAERSRAWVLQGALRHPVAALEAFDAAVYLRINGLLLGKLTDRVLTGLSNVMTYGEGWAVVALAMVAVNFRSGLMASLEALPTLWLTLLTVNLALKKIFRRRRPFIEFVKARVLGPRPTDFSFPSGHAAAGFAGAFLMGAHAPALYPLFYVIATLVGLSRVYLGVHYPSDVAFGAAAGTLLAAVYRVLWHIIIPIGSAPI